MTKLVRMVVNWINDLSEAELFQPEQRKWVHINTVAPFTSFRTKIRKWKK